MWLGGRVLPNPPNPLGYGHVSAPESESTFQYGNSLSTRSTIPEISFDPEWVSSETFQFLSYSFSILISPSQVRSQLISPRHDRKFRFPMTDGAKGTFGKTSRFQDLHGKDRAGEIGNCEADMRIEKTLDTLEMEKEEEVSKLFYNGKRSFGGRKDLQRCN